MKSLILSAALLALSLALPAQANEELAKKHLCTTCHVVKGTKTIGPTYADVAKKYAGQSDAEAKLAEKVKKGGSGFFSSPHPIRPMEAASRIIASLEVFIEISRKTGDE